MRNLLVILVALGLLCNLANAQSSLHNQKPVHLVEHAKSANKKFTAIPLLAKSSNQQVSAALIQEAPEYTILDVDPVALDILTSESNETITLDLPTDDYGTLSLELVQVDITSNILVYEASTMEQANIDLAGVYYRGIIKNTPNSLVSISIFDDEITGLISADNIGNLVIGKLKSDDLSSQHIVYNDQELMQSHELNCETPDDNGSEYTRDQLEYQIHGRSSNCVNIYIEVDNDIYQDFGGTANTVNYVTAVFNEVATLYANEGVTIQISEIFIWDTTSPYNGTSSSQMLSQFQSLTNNFNGDLGMLLSYQASGGIAVLDGVCHPLVDARLCFCSVSSNYQQVPTYSWTVMVVAHELGHLMGSKHTHACAWNGNNTAIDGCAGFTEGSCSVPSSPTTGGTIMSYCHITQYGINFTKGFGVQPGSVIRNNIDNASCLVACESHTCGDGIQNGQETGIDCGGPDCPSCLSCDDNTLIVSLKLDDYSTETSWKILDEEGSVMYEYGPYAKELSGQIVKDTLCLIDGCYTFEIADAYGDGICCEYGNGYYRLQDSEGNILQEGGEFGDKDVKNICLPDGFSSDGDCLDIDFNAYDVLSFGGSQDGGNYEILEGGRMLRISNNAWKAIELPYTVTENTVISFDFGSTIEGEIHGIGFDDNSSISSSKTFKVHGTQNWGINDYDNYAGNNVWQSYVIPVGQYYTGDYVYLFFVADHDGAPKNGNSFFRNIRIYEGEGCTSDTPEDDDPELVGSEEELSMNVFPNPTSNELNIKLDGPALENATAEIYNVMGQRVYQQRLNKLQGLSYDALSVAHLPEGSYVIRVYGEKEEQVRKFTIAR